MENTCTGDGLTDKRGAQWDEKLGPRKKNRRMANPKGVGTLLGAPQNLDSGYTSGG